MLQQQERIVISYYVTICTFAIAHTSSASIYEYANAMLIYACASA